MTSQFIMRFYRLTANFVQQRGAAAVRIMSWESGPESSEIRTVSEEQLQRILTQEEQELENSIVEQFEERDSANMVASVSTPITSEMIAAAKRLKAETGRATFRQIEYSDGELAQSDLSLPPSPSNPHPFEPSALPPTHSHSLVPFVNHSPLLRFLVEIGVDLAEIENTTSVGRHLLRLRMEEVLPKIELMQKEVGFENEEIGRYLTRNPFFLLQDVKDMQTRLNYLEMKKFTKPERRKIVDSYRYWLNCNVQLIDSRLGWLQKQFQLSAKTTREIVVKEPRVIMFGTGPLERLVKMFTKELNFTDNQLKRLLVEDPRLFMMDSKLVSRTYRYVRDVMRINNVTILEHPFILRCSLSVIRSRHDFLQKLGRARYRMSSRKESERDSSDVVDQSGELVDLEDFLDPSDAGFAMKAAKSYPVVYDRFLRNC